MANPEEPKKDPNDPKVLQDLKDNKESTGEKDRKTGDGKHFLYKESDIEINDYIQGVPENEGIWDDDRD